MFDRNQSPLRKTLALAALAFLAVGCATTEPSMENKVAAEAPVTQKGELAMRGAELFANMRGVTEDQKNRIMKIHAEAMVESQKISSEIQQSKSLLFKTLANPNYKASEVSYLKDKIVSLDKSRLDLMFASLDKVEKVLGKSEARQQVFERLMDNPYEHFRY